MPKNVENKAAPVIQVPLHSIPVNQFNEIREKYPDFNPPIYGYLDDNLLLIDITVEDGSYFRKIGYDAAPVPNDIAYNKAHIFIVGDIIENENEMVANADFVGDS